MTIAVAIEKQGAVQPGDAGEDGKQPRQRRDGSELLDESGPASKIEGVRKEPVFKTPKSNPPAQIWQIRAGLQCTPIRVTPEAVDIIDREAIEKVCGVSTAMLQGHSWAPNLSIG